jgi:hypothetical protein
MSDFFVEIIDQINYIQIDTSVFNNINNIEVQTSEIHSVEISTTFAGTVLVNDIIGLDSYLNNYTFDCGTP